MSATDEFDALRRQAIEELGREDVRSLYVGSMYEREENAYYFANDIDEEDEEAFQEAVATQLGMFTRVLAARSDLSVEAVTGLARRRAEEMDLRS